MHLKLSICFIFAISFPSDRNPPLNSENPKKKKSQKYLARSRPEKRRAMSRGKSDSGRPKTKGLCESVGEKASPDTTRVATRAFLGRANQYLEGRRLRPDERRRGRRNVSHSPLSEKERTKQRERGLLTSLSPPFLVSNGPRAAALVTKVSLFFADLSRSSLLFLFFCFNFNLIIADFLQVLFYEIIHVI